LYLYARAPVGHKSTTRIISLVGAPSMLTHGLLRGLKTSSNSL
jgi:hypothetical protein